jgi:hypothetical protein
MSAELKQFAVSVVNRTGFWVNIIRRDLFAGAILALLS